MASHSTFRSPGVALAKGRSPWALVFTIGVFVLAIVVGAVVPLVGLAKMKWVIAAVIGMIGSSILFARPGIAIALYMFVGTIKADPVIGGMMPFDLTAALGGMLVLACVIKLVRSDGLPYFPRSYGLYAVIILPMIASLLYTPVLSVGADKAGRFLVLTGIAIISPFVLLDSPKRVRVFLYSMGAIGLMISAESLANLGGSDRLTAPGASTIQLGTAAGTGMAIAWSLLLPELPLRRRILVYPAVGALFIALLGSGARGPLIGSVCCILFVLWKFRKLAVDIGILTAAGFVGLAKVGIPAASFKYLGTLINGDPAAAMATRNNLLLLAWHLFQEHPFLGVGIGGYQYFSPDPENIFPHNIFLELGAELGIIPVVAFTGLVIWAFWEAFQQLRDLDFPYWQESFAVLSLLIFGFLQMIKSGDINDNRTMWFAMGLPFLLRYLAKRAPSQDRGSDSLAAATAA
jgi:O-antigen ligase